ncbi:MAG: RCC1 domain-containing protein, partial [Coriobacteriia bacterium]|nr:RCC1 domain-containing protein [Coriobacteriia bacterium]
MTARTSNAPSRGHLKRSKSVILLLAILLLALPLFAVANSSAVQSAFQPVQAAFQPVVTAVDDGFVPNQAPAVATSGFSAFSSSGITPAATLFSAGSAHSLGIKPDGTLWGWGENQFGAT